MRNFQQKRVWRNIMQSKPVLILLGILILFFAWSVLGLWNKVGETSKNKKIVEEKVALLKQQKENILSDINNLNTVEGKEKLFREDYSLAKEGENLIVIVEDKNPPAVPAKPSSSFWSFFKNLFK